MTDYSKYFTPERLASLNTYLQNGFFRKQRSYDDLPLDELRAVNDPEKYGWGSVLRNIPVYHQGRAHIPVSPNLEQRWDCGVGARKLEQDLTARGIDAKVVYGIDQAQSFSNHVWVELTDGRQLDPTPLYPFTNTHHEKRGEVKTGKDEYIKILSGSTAPCSLRTLSPEEAYLSELGFGVQRDPVVTTIRIYHQIKKIVYGEATRFSSVQNTFSYEDGMPLEWILERFASVAAEDFRSEMEKEGFSTKSVETGILNRRLPVSYPNGMIDQKLQTLNHH